MSEAYLTIDELAAKLKVGKTKLYAVLPSLMARGLKKTIVGRRARYLESSLDAVLKKAAETETPIR